MRNDGTAAAKVPWTDRVVLSQDDVFGNGDDVQLATASASSDVPAGQTYTQQVSVPLPFGLTGSYHVFIQLDSVVGAEGDKHLMTGCDRLQGV